jgi:uncharacterized protein (TIGR03067 family)
MLRLALGLLYFVAPALLAAEPEGDLKALQGTWVLESATLAGRDHTDDFKTMKLTVSGDKYTVGFGDIGESGTVKLDPDKTPKQIDLTTQPGGPFKGRALPGIYELKDGTVVLCLNSEMPDRPTKLDAPAKTKLMLFTFKRDKK